MARHLSKFEEEDVDLEVLSGLAPAQQEGVLLQLGLTIGARIKTLRALAAHTAESAAAAGRSGAGSGSGRAGKIEELSLAAQCPPSVSRVIYTFLCPAKPIPGQHPSGPEAKGRRVRRVRCTAAQGFGMAVGQEGEIVSACDSCLP